MLISPQRMKHYNIVHSKQAILKACEEAAADRECSHYINVLK